MLDAGGILPKSFYLRPVDTVALDLLGRCLRLGDVMLRITEVEAYGGPEDSASHCRAGRNAPQRADVGGRGPGLHLPLLRPAPHA